MVAMVLILASAWAFAPHAAPRCATERCAAAGRSAPVVAQWGGFKVQKSERLLIREAWERADALRPGKPNWFTQKPKDLLELHEEIVPSLESAPPSPTAIPGSGNVTSLLGALLKSLSTGDLALTLCSKEPPVLTELRDWLVEKLPMEIAVMGLPEEQGRVLGTLVRSMDARRIIDLGTFTGYSSIAMGLASAADAKISCCEVDREYARSARDWWLKAGVSSKMEMHECSAEELMQSLLDKGEANTVDFIFCDVGNRERYPQCHELAMQLLNVGGVVVYYDTLWAADPVLQHGHYPEMREFNEALAKDPRVLASLVPLSYGITITMKVLNLDGQALQAAQQAAGDDALAALLRERRAAVAAELDSI